MVIDAFLSKMAIKPARRGKEAVTVYSTRYIEA